MATLGFELSVEQVAFQDALKDFFSHECSLALVRKAFENGWPVDGTLWEKCLGLGLVETFFGVGFGSGESGQSSFVELALVAETSGAALSPEPLSELLLAGSYLVNELGLGDQRLSECKTGKMRVGITRCGVGKRKHVFVGGSSLDALVVLDLEHGSVHLLEQKTAGKAWGALEAEVLDRSQNFRVVDGDLGRVLSGVTASQIDNLLLILKASEVAGIVGRVVQMTTEYVKTRTQFGVPIGGFQAVQHKLADMYLAAEGLRALTRFAAWAVVNDRTQVALASHAAIRQATTVGAKIVEASIQLHGGTGFTWEFDLHLFLRRVKAIEVTYKPSVVDADQLIEAAGTGSV